jgi:hypothetical protein
MASLEWEMSFSFVACSYISFNTSVKSVKNLLVDIVCIIISWIHNCLIN